MRRMRIALIHATPLAVEPINAAFAAGWADADVVNILDDSLSADRARAGDLDEPMYRRFESLVRYTEGIGSSGILFTCSAFGPAIERAARTTGLPVLKPNEAMFDAAIAAGRRIGMVATFAPSVESMRAEFAQAAATQGLERDLEIVLAAGAMEAMRSGDAATHDRLIADAAAQLDACDAIMLAQFSMARALPLVHARTAKPVYTSPESAVRRMRTVLQA